MTPSRKSYTERWRRCKRLGLVEEDSILCDNELTLRGFLAVVLGGILAIGLVITAITVPISIAQCSQTGQLYGLPHHWTVLSGCFLRLPDGHYITTGAYQAFQQVKR